MTAHTCSHVGPHTPQCFGHQVVDLIFGDKPWFTPDWSWMMQEHKQVSVPPCDHCYCMDGQFHGGKAHVKCHKCGNEKLRL